MTDLEMTKLCAQAMVLNFHIAKIDDGEIWVRCPPMKPPAMYSYRYCPLVDDAQAMALVKKFKLVIDHYVDDEWAVSISESSASADHADLNRAIVECVAKMQAAK